MKKSKNIFKISIIILIIVTLPLFNSLFATDIDDFSYKGAGVGSIEPVYNNIFSVFLSLSNIIIFIIACPLLVLIQRSNKIHETIKKKISIVVITLLLALLLILCLLAYFSDYYVKIGSILVPNSCIEALLSALMLIILLITASSSKISKKLKKILYIISIIPGILLVIQFIIAIVFYIISALK